MSDLDIDTHTTVNLVDRITDRQDSDLYLYAGDITMDGYDQVCERLESLHNDQRKPNAAVFLNTFGGDAHAAYRMARAFGHHYSQLTLYVFGQCKSAGTLMAMGFNKIIIGDRGELGPIDVQMISREELFEYNSGLDMIQAMDFLQRHAKATFQEFLRDIRLKTRLGTKSAGEMARQLTEGMFAGIYNQLDPVRLGHVQRTMSITHAYGTRLLERSRALRSGLELEELVYQYPSHDFVIDRKEAKQLFADGVVRAPEQDENFLGTLLYQLYPAEQRQTEFIPLKTALHQINQTEPKQPQEPPKPVKRGTRRNKVK